jgi:hypothetical protein
MSSADGGPDITLKTPLKLAIPVLIIVNIPIICSSLGSLLNIYLI